jgi:large subunit ribosomal protein L37Ae
MKKGKGSTNRFGTRYGLTLKKRLSDVETKPVGKCPYCSSSRDVRRKAAGIWTCKKCKNTFTGKAYQVE